MLTFLVKSLQICVLNLNFEKQIITKTAMAELVGVKSTYTLDCIKMAKRIKILLSHIQN